MVLWRIHIRPSANEDIDPVEVCLEQDVVGVGWRVPEPPASKEEYYEQGEQRYGTSSWRTVLTSLLDDLEENHLVWFRDFEGIYYLARVTDGWEYRTGPAHREADLFNVRPAEIYEVERTVPGKLKNCFIPPLTLQPVNSDTVRAFSKLVFNQLSGRDVYEVPEFDLEDLFDLLDDIELEDLTALYLQLTEDYVMVPSSRESQGTTMAYEFEMISRSSSQRAYVQVKSGNVKLDPRKYEQLSGIWYLFSPAGYKTEPSTDRVRVIPRDEMQAFATDYEDQLPVSIRAWIEFARDSS